MFRNKKSKRAKVIDDEPPRRKKVPAVIIEEQLISLERLVSCVLGGFETICGMKHQLNHHTKLITLVEKELTDLQDLKASAIPYTPEELHKLEECLSMLYEVIVRLQPAAHTDVGILLKEIRTLLSIAYERQNLVACMSSLINFLTDHALFSRKYGKEIAEGKLADIKAIRAILKNDETSFIPLLRQKCARVVQMDPSLQSTVTNMLEFFTTAVNLVGVLDALDIEEVTNFDRMIRRRILVDECEIDKANITFTDVNLGDGIFGTVEEAEVIVKTMKNGRMKKVLRKVALKTMEIDDEVLKDEYVELTNEVAKWRTISNPYIIKCYGMALRSKHVHLVFERMDKSLFEYLHHDRRVLKREEYDIITMDVVVALLQLHVMNIIHRNLTSRSILLSPKGIEGGVKLADFGQGLAKLTAQTRGIHESTPPEVLVNNSPNFNNHGWTMKGDIYSLGLLLWEMGQDDKVPFEKHMFHLHQHVGVEKKGLSFANGRYPEYLKVLLRDCMSFEPWRRPTAQNVCNVVYRNIKNEDDVEEVSKAVEEMHVETKEDFQAQVYQKPTNNRMSVIVTGHEVSRPERPGKGKAMVRRGVQSMRHRGQHIAVVEEESDEEEEVEMELSEDEGEGEYEESVEDERGSEPFRRSTGGREERFSDDGDGLDMDPGKIERARRKDKLMQLAIKESSNPSKVNKRFLKEAKKYLTGHTLNLNSTFGLMLFKKKLTDVDCEVVKCIIAWNKNMQRVILEDNKISDAGVDEMAYVIGKHPNMLQVILTNNPLITDVSKLLKCVQYNEILEVLDLDGCNLGDIAAREIAKFFDKGSVLLQLNIKLNKITNKGMIEIAKGLENNTTLKGIVVSPQNGVKCGKGLKMIKKVLKKKETIYNKKVVQ